MKCSKFVAKIAYFEEAYRDTLTRKTQFAVEFWTFRQASEVLLYMLWLDYEQALTGSITRTFELYTEVGRLRPRFIRIYSLIRSFFYSHATAHF